MTASLDLSVVVPIYNEEESLPKLARQLLDALQLTKKSFEIILVNDGSQDRSAEVMSHLSDDFDELVCILLRKNSSRPY